jgi:hypothetical protein
LDVSLADYAPPNAAIQGGGQGIQVVESAGRPSRSR